MHALIIEDDTAIAEFIARGLREAGFAVDVAADGNEGLEAALTGEIDVAIVDLMLPGRDGLSVIDELRRQGRSTPVLILSARRSVDDRVRGLQAGGDDYLTKPFAFAELLARVQALVRRASRTPEATTLTVGDLVLDLLSRKVTRAGQPIELRPREFALLEYLMRNAGKVVSKDENTYLIVPTGVTLKGEGLNDLGVHQQTQAHIYGLTKPAYTIQLTGSLAPPPAGASDSQAESEGPKIEQVMPRVYGNRYLILGSALGILALGFALLYRMSPGAR